MIVVVVTCRYGRVAACFASGRLGFAHGLDTEPIELLQLLHRSVGAARREQSLTEDAEWIVRRAVTKLRVRLRYHLHC